MLGRILDGVQKLCYCFVRIGVRKFQMYLQALELLGEAYMTEMGFQKKLGSQWHQEELGVASGVKGTS